MMRVKINPGQGINKWANVRYNNPGSIQKADWGRQFGARTYSNLQGTSHNIMNFPNKVSGGAALFYLLNRSYTGMTLRNAVQDWTDAGSGHPGTGTKADLKNYISGASKATGLKDTDIITPEFLASPAGIGLAKSFDGLEESYGLKGSPEYPMSDDEWTQAHDWGTGQWQAVRAQAKAAAANDPYANIGTGYGAGYGKYIQSVIGQ
jgi:hypothetical protein